MVQDDFMLFSLNEENKELGIKHIEEYLKLDEKINCSENF